MNNFEFQTVFANDITKNSIKFYIFLRFLHFLIKLWLPKCFQSTQNFKKHELNFLNCVSSYFGSIVTQNRAIAAKNGCGRAKTACSPRFFKSELFFFQDMSGYTTDYPKNGARHDCKKFSFLASV